MCRGSFNVAAATALYFLIHSALAGMMVKTAATHLLGQRMADGLYRPFYLFQAAVLLALLVYFVRKQNGRELYRLQGIWMWLLRGAQAAVLACLLWSLLQVGFSHFFGSDSFSAWYRGANEIPPMPDGQETSPTGDGNMRTSGLLGYTRHALNWLFLTLFWLNPRMTTRFLAFNVVTTVYILLGSLNADRHLLMTYGEAYRRYQEQVPFFF